MRPKKVILLCCDDEARGEELRFLLRTRNFAVTMPCDLAAGTELDNHPDAALVVQSLPSYGEDAICIKEVIRMIREFADIPVMLVKESFGDTTTTIPVDIFCAAETSHADMVERLRILVTRKRGPKKRASEKEVVA